MEIDEFLDKVVNGENVVPEKPKSEIEAIIDNILSTTFDKIAVSDKIISELQNYSKKVDSDWSLAESKIAKIKEFLLEIRNFISADNIAEAKRVFMQINELYDLIPDEFAEFKNELKKDMSAVEAALMIKVVDFEKRDFERKKKIIGASVQRAKIFLQEKRTEDSIKEYYRINEIYNSLPQGFIKERIALYEEITELFKEILISEQINNLQNRLDFQR